LLRRFGAGKAPLPGDEIDEPEAEGDLILANTSTRARATSVRGSYLALA
jgi:hypothetical protein